MNGLDMRVLRALKIHLGAGEANEIILKYGGKFHVKKGRTNNNKNMFYDSPKNLMKCKKGMRVRYTVRASFESSSRPISGTAIRVH